MRAIADCATPIVVAVGHEDDETLAERVADRRAMTPTEAGVAVAPRIDRVRRRAQTVEGRIELTYADLVESRLAEFVRRGMNRSRPVGPDEPNAAARWKPIATRGSLGESRGLPMESFGSLKILNEG